MQRSRPLPRWILIALGASLAMLLLAAIGLFSLYRAPAPAGFGPMPAFSLTAQNGKTVTHESLKGQVLVFSFIFTSCTDICPVITTQMRELQAELAAGGMAGDVRLLSITVDPERDTPEVLAAYASNYGADTAGWDFLTGDLAQIKQVVTGGFLLALDKADSHAGHGAQTYGVTHSDRIVLVDRQGNIQAYHSSQDLDMAKLLREIQALR